MNIIIPAAGIGKRFLDDNYLMPKPLINVLGEPMLAHVIRSIHVDPSDRIHIVYAQGLDRYSFRHVLRKTFYGHALNFIPLNFNTRGPAETVLCGLNKIADLGEAVLVLDCDTFYGDDVVSTVKADPGNCIFYFEDQGDQPIFSYIKIDAENRVIEIKEKARISNNACAGAYVFRSGRLLKEYCEQVLNAGIQSRGEYYLSNVYAQMLEGGEEVRAARLEKFVCVGTPQQLKTYCLSGGALKKRFCFDLDGTLVTFPETEDDYTSVKPIARNIRFLRYLHTQGHTIIIQTARKMLSSNYNSGQATRNAHRDVFDTLDKYDIPFDEIYFGKPHAHFYIDDLSAKPFDVEKETGFYNTRIEARHFNTIEYGGDHVVKTTSNPGEVYWYRHIPPSVKKHFALAEISGGVLKLEKIKGIVFSYLLVNNSLTQANLENLLEVVGRLHTSEEVTALGIDFNENYNAKMRRRYSEFDYESISSEAACCFEKIFNRLAGHTPSLGVIHGDLVFSNIFLCDHQLIKFIDMRGRVDGVETIFGDVFYDYAKIYQSLWGYDFILNDCESNETYLKELREFFEAAFVDRFSAAQLEELRYITAGLLFSLIPLHTDREKQRRYFELIERCL